MLDLRPLRPLGLDPPNGQRSDRIGVKAKKFEVEYQGTGRRMQAASTWTP